MRSIYYGESLRCAYELNETTGEDDTIGRQQGETTRYRGLGHRSYQRVGLYGARCTTAWLGREYGAQELYDLEGERGRRSTAWRGGECGAQALSALMLLIWFNIWLPWHGYQHILRGGDTWLAILGLGAVHGRAAVCVPVGCSVGQASFVCAPGRAGQRGKGSGTWQADSMCERCRACQMSIWRALHRPIWPGRGSTLGWQG